MKRTDQVIRDLITIINSQGPSSELLNYSPKEIIQNYKPLQEYHIDLTNNKTKSYLAFKTFWNALKRDLKQQQDNNLFITHKNTDKSQKQISSNIHTMFHSFSSSKESSSLQTAGGDIDSLFQRSLGTVQDLAKAIGIENSFKFCLDPLEQQALQASLEMGGPAGAKAARELQNFQRDYEILVEAHQKLVNKAEAVIHDAEMKKKLLQGPVIDFGNKLRELTIENNQRVAIAMTPQKMQHPHRDPTVGNVTPFRCNTNNQRHNIDSTNPSSNCAINLSASASSQYSNNHHHNHHQPYDFSNKENLQSRFDFKYSSNVTQEENRADKLK